MLTAVSPVSAHIDNSLLPNTGSPASFFTSASSPIKTSSPSDRDLDSSGDDSFHEFSIDDLYKLEHTAHILARERAEQHLRLLEQSSSTDIIYGQEQPILSATNILDSPAAIHAQAEKPTVSSRIIEADKTHRNTLESVLRPFSNELGLNAENMSSAKPRKQVRVDLSHKKTPKKSSQASEQGSLHNDPDKTARLNAKPSPKKAGSNDADSQAIPSQAGQSRVAKPSIHTSGKKRRPQPHHKSGKIVEGSAVTVEEDADEDSQVDAALGEVTPLPLPVSVTIQPASDNPALDEMAPSNVGPRLQQKKNVDARFNRLESAVSPQLGTGIDPRHRRSASEYAMRTEKMELERQLKELVARQAAILVQAEQERLLRSASAIPLTMQARDMSVFNSQNAFADAGALRALTNIYVNNLPETTTDEALYQLGSVCGTVVSHKAMIDLEKGTCKGYGFIMYSTPEEAQRAIIWFSSNGFQTSYAKESFSAKLRRMADKASTNVYLSNLPVKFTAQQLEQLFAPHPVISLRILTDANGESRGVGFVRLRDREVAQECIDRLHGKILQGTTQPLQVRFADSDAQKQLKQTMSTKRTIESLGLHKLKNVTGGALLPSVLGTPPQNMHLMPNSYSSQPTSFIPGPTELLSPMTISSGSPALSGTPDLSASSSISSSRSTPNLAVMSPAKFGVGSVGGTAGHPLSMSLMDVYASLSPLQGKNSAKVGSFTESVSTHDLLEHQQLYHFNLKQEKRQAEQLTSMRLKKGTQASENSSVIQQTGLPAHGLGLAAAFGGNLMSKTAQATGAPAELLSMGNMQRSCARIGVQLPQLPYPQSKAPQLDSSGGNGKDMGQSGLLPPIHLGLGAKTSSDGTKAVRKYAIPIRPPPEEGVKLESSKSAAKQGAGQESSNATKSDTIVQVTEESNEVVDANNVIGPLGLGLLNVQADDKAVAT